MKPPRPRNSPRPHNARRDLGGDQVEGRQAVRELLVAGRRKVYELWVASDDDRGPLRDLTELANKTRVTVKRVSAGKLAGAARTDSPQGVLAHCAPLAEVELDALTKRRKGVAPFLVAVDGVTDPGNLGALLRAAECNGATGVVLPRHRSVHITPTVTKAAAGAIEHLAMTVVAGLPSALESLKAAGVWVIGLDGGGDTLVDRLTLATEPLVLVLGAEGTGLSPLVRKRCDVLAAIPLRGRLASLNVAAAAAIATYEVARLRALTD